MSNRHSWFSITIGCSWYRLKNSIHNIKSTPSDCEGYANIRVSHFRMIWHVKQATLLWEALYHIGYTFATCISLFEGFHNCYSVSVHDAFVSLNVSQQVTAEIGGQGRGHGHDLFKKIADIKRTNRGHACPTISQCIYTFEFYLCYKSIPSF